MPQPAANYQILPAGSLVIAMDNATQANSTNNFNLRSYGLVVFLLNNNVKVSWIIQSGKSKDGIDFSTTACMVKPSIGTISNFNFKAGPFVVSVNDTIGVAGLIDNFNSNTSQATNKVKVYRTMADAMVDQRYNLTGFKPKAALLNNGGNWTIHKDYLLAAGINFGINSIGTMATNWEQAIASDLMSSCFTFASEGHWSESNLTTAKNVTNNIRTFLLAGGNVLAECAAVRTYENVGRFHSTGGINVTTENAFSNALTTLSYNNADLSYSQFNGDININKGGSLKNWTYSGSIQNNEHNHVNGTQNNTNIGASVSKLNTGQNGGLLFYLGNHKFDRIDDLTVLNGIRMYLNAFLTPPPNNNTVCLNIGNPGVGIDSTQCFSSPSRPYVNAKIEWSYNKINLTYTIRTTLSKEFVDNTYGASSIGWGWPQHNFNDVAASDFLQISLVDKAGVKKMEMKLDYISSSLDVSSGYRSLGVKGGNGKMITGQATDVVRVKTSLDKNFNDNGYVLINNSPLTNYNYGSNSFYPNWTFEVWYEVEVKASAFGKVGFGKPYIASLNAIPSKTGLSTEPVLPSDCALENIGDRTLPNMQDKGLPEEMHIFPVPAKNNFDVSIIALKENYQTIHVIDAMGKIVSTKMIHVIPGKNVFHFETKNIASGSYNVRIFNEGKITNQKIIVLK